MRHKSKFLLATAVVAALLLGYLALDRFSGAVEVEPFIDPHGTYGAAGAGNATAACVKCHGGHNDLALNLLRQPSQRETCYACHKSGLPNNTSPDVKGEFGENVIGESVMASYHPVPTGILLCTSCHDPHLKPDQLGGTAALLSVGPSKVSTGNTVCGVCHGPGNFLPEGDMVTSFVYTAHDKMNAPSSNTQIKCIRCHQPHGSPFDYLLRTSIVDEGGVSHTVYGDDNTVCFACHNNATGSYSGQSIYQQVKHGGASSAFPTFTETSRGDFAQGSLTGVSASSAGELTLGGDSGRIFNGATDKIDTGSGYTTIQNTFSYEFWANPSATEEIDAQSTSGTVGTAGEKYAIGAQHGGSSGLAGAGVSVGTNGVSVYEHADSYMPALLVYSGTISGWTHIAVVYNNKTPSLYINGVLIKTGLTSPKNPFPSNTFGYGPYGYFSGSLRDIRIWNYARSQAQIQNDMNRQLAGSESGLVGYWKLNEGSGTMAYDSAGTNNGTMTGTVCNHYSASGNRISPDFSLSATFYKSSQIQWNATTPASTTLTVETNVYLNGSWLGWQTAANGGTIPGFGAGTNMTGGKIKYRVNLSTLDQTVTPSLQDIGIDINHTSNAATLTYPGTGYEGSLCLNCHEPHGKAGNPDYKRADGNTLCTNCHDANPANLPAKYSYRGIATYDTTPHSSATTTVGSAVYRAGANPGDCDNCHDPHGKNDGSGNLITKQLLLEQDSICFGGTTGCHRDPNNSFLGINIYQRFNAGTDSTSHHSISTVEQSVYGTQLQCVNCHDPHSNTAQNPVIDPALSSDLANRYTIMNLNNTISNYINGSGEVYMMIKAMHDGAPPQFAFGPSVSAMAATSSRVSWITNETATGYVEYGTTTSYGTKLNTPGSYTSQGLNITGLTSGVNYHYRVCTIDQVGNYTYSTDQLLDPNPPGITYGPALINSSGTSITVTWNTDEVSTSKVDYVDDANYSVNNYTYSTNDTSMVTSHSITLSGLQSGAKYHFRIRSMDYRGNETIGPDNVFTMVPPPAAPILTPQADVWNYATTATVNLQWTPGVDPSGGPDQFYAQISSSNTFASGVQTSDWVYGNNWSVTISNDDWLIWYWRVKARNPINLMESVWSSVYSFGHQGVQTVTSCPIIYLWDGTKYEYLSDMAGSDLGLEIAPGKYTQVYPDLPVAVPQGRLQAKDGYYTLKFKTERDEVDYIDNLKLEAVDHPVGTEIALNDMNRGSAHKLYTYTQNLKMIKKATYADHPTYSRGKPISGVDITDLVKRHDNKEAVGSFGDDNQFIFDLGDLNGAQTIKLVMNGWTEYPSKQERADRLKNAKKGLKMAPNLLEILQPDGTWKQQPISFFSGYSKTVVLDLSGQFPQRNPKYIIRLRGLLRPHFDFVGVDTSPQAEIKAFNLDPVKASLAYRGIAQRDQAPKPYYHYDITTDSKLSHEGRFTRYGDVLPLLKQIDDRFIVMDTGDELSVNFAALPPPAPGMVRSFVIRPWQYYKEYEAAQTDPMPFRKMDLSKWPDLGDYPAELQKYVTEWNTRIHHAGQAQADKPGIFDKIKKFFADVIDSMVKWWKGLSGKKNQVAYVRVLPYTQPPLDKSWKRYLEPHYSLNTNYVAAETDNTQSASYYDPNSAGFAMWDGTTQPTPSLPGNDASANKSKAATRDSSWWVTNAYPPNQNDGESNYQMVKFVIPGSVSKMTALKLYWQGYGEPNTAYPVSVNVWNFQYARWDLVTTQAVTSDKGINFQSYIDYQPLCLKCHGGTVPPGVNLGSATRNVASAFPADIHGGGAGPQYVNGSEGGGYSTNSMAAPYAQGQAALPCTDCHDVHGSQNVYHLRENINQTLGLKVTGTDISKNAEVTAYCNSCHPGTVAQFHAGCMSCHNSDHEGVTPAGADFSRACLSCHTHGGSMPPHGQCHCSLNYAVKAF